MLDTLDLEQVSASILTELEFAKRPVLIFGYGIKLARAEALARSITEILNIPVCPTWGAIDAFPAAVGAFGTHGIRAANFAIQNADYILCIGSRLDTKATGSPASSFAPKARLVMVDIDGAELAKMEKIGRPLYRAVMADAKQFLSMLSTWITARCAHDLNAGTFRNPDWDAWAVRVQKWKEKYPPGAPCEGIDPYQFMRDLGKHLSADDVIVSDTGCSLGWAMQAYPFKGETFIHAFNQTPMGYGLPAAIGAAFATGKRVILITGDGGLSVNITEFATVRRHGLPIKTLLFNNQGHAMCRQTQRQWLGGEYPSTSFDGGLATPDFVAVANAYGIPAERPFEGRYGKWRVETLLPKMLALDGPAMLEIPIHPDTGIAPQARFGAPLEDQEPVMDRDELAEVMEAA